MSDFTHLDKDGHVRMVDVTEKQLSNRTARAQGVIHMKKSTYDKIQKKALKKGNVLETARIAGIMATKKTDSLIPMCHPLNITHAGIDFYPNEMNHEIKIVCEVRLTGKTGVEMEALTGVTIAGLTIYDMCKSEDKEMVLTDIFLLEKAGGKSGNFRRKEST